ncbi:MAG: hypothetical protein IVW57_10105 [Ktedonobacterales bacterium]|nr:hypothetical protein [Ktedonobacterales bacterium]
MRYTSDEQRRDAFRGWLQAELRRLDFYQRRGSRYLVSEFARYAKQLDARVEEVSLGRYLREKDPVLPTPESCRELARALGRHSVEVLMRAGYLTPEDFYYLPNGVLSTEELRRHQEEIDGYTYLPAAIRELLKAALEHQPRVPHRATADVVAPSQEVGAHPLEPTAEEATPNEWLPTSVTSSVASRSIRRAGERSQ